MKSSLPVFISFLLLLFSSNQIQAEFTLKPSATSDCEYSAENLLLPDLDNSCYPPYWHNTYEITHNSATFHWEDVYGASYYTVQWRYPGGSWHDLPGYCYQNWITVTNLQSCTAYEWRVRSHCGYGYTSNWCYPVSFTTLCYDCHPPAWLHCYNITGYTATWKWDGVYGADYYAIQWRYPGGSWYDLAGGPFYGTWVDVHHLHPCSTYEFRVKSYCHYAGWSNWCHPHVFSTPCHNACPVPTGLMTKDIGDTKATFKWSPVHGAHNYSIQIKDPWGNWYDVPGSPTAGIWITAYNLTPCKTYQWRIKANCGYYSSSQWSQPMTFTTTCGHGCYAPEWVYTNGVSSNSANLHWTPVVGAAYYVVEWRTPGGTWNQLQGGPWSGTTAVLTGLQSNTTYEWRVKAFCYTGHSSGWSAVTHFTTLGPSCGMPFFRYTLPITDSTATFNWTAVTGAVNYTVQIRLLNGQWQDVVGSPTTATSITATGLLPNTEYEWRMQVNCANGGHSVWQSPIRFITGTSPGCNTPSGLHSDQVTMNSVTLHWNAVQDAVTYSVEIRALPHGAWNPVAGSPVDTNLILVDGLSSFTTYEWRVRANCNGGNHSFWSAPVQFTITNAPACNPPGGLSVSSITETTATLSWSPVSGGQGYHVQTRLPNGVWVDHPGGIVADTFVLASGFTPNTTYEWRVRTKCDTVQFSHWTPPAMFTTTGSGPGNNECGTAMLLTVETSCVTTFASNINATPSDPPPAGGCWSNGYRDVWFKFTMPNVTNPTVTIRTSAGSLGNAVMEVYSGTDCSILSLIACEDNNDNGNGSSMPVINLTGSPNATIWVRVWGYDGATGTFTICVFNYISFNYTAIAEENAPEEGIIIEEVEEAVPFVEAHFRPELQLTPNPVSDQLNVEVLQPEGTQVIGLRIVDLSGKTAFTQKVERVDEDVFRTQVDVSDLQPGIYVLQVQTTKGMLAEKISVIR